MYARPGQLICMLIAFLEARVGRVNKNLAINPFSLLPPLLLSLLPLHNHFVSKKKDIIYCKGRYVQEFWYTGGVSSKAPCRTAEREVCPMRTNKILNIMMSAAVMASVASGTVLAEETEAEMEKMQ